MKCPVCNDVNLAMTDRQGVEIDYCPQCRGVWLDRGELDKLVERSVADAPFTNVSERHVDRHHESHSRRHRHKSVLERLFDF